MSSVKQNEYWGTVRQSDRIDHRIAEPDLSQAVRVSQCGTGHTWPARGSGPCERCGKPSSLPTAHPCPHGVPDGGRFGGHDCTYASLRESLIPFAEALTNSVVPEPRAGASDATTTRYNREWTGTFSGLMEHLMYLVTHGRVS